MSDKNVIVTMPDGSEWAVPLRVIAENQMKWIDENVDSGDECYSNVSEILESYSRYPHEAIFWAKRNVNWSDVQAHVKIHKHQPSFVDYQEGWVNGEARIE